MRCPYCTGKIKVKIRDGKIVYRCRNFKCKREYIVDVIRGGLRQVS